MKLTKRRFLLILLCAAALALSVLAFLPEPVTVETGPVTRGPLRESVDEEGETRARDRYTLAAPVAGRLERPVVRQGDAVRRGQEVTHIHLAPMDPREREEARARLRSAEALRREAGEMVARAAADAEQAKRDRERAERLERGGYVAFQDLEKARSAETVAARALEAARFRAKAAAADVEGARAALMAAEPEAGDARRVLALASPVDGRVLRLLEESERVVSPGTPLAVIGDAARLEVVIDVLTSDAVRIRPGMPVLLEGWGGEQALRAEVRLVEPSAFTKVSALGVEEQRVNVVADFVDPPGPLGDGYRVEAKIVVWSGDRVLQAPGSAVFRGTQGDGWAVFTAAGDRARLRAVEVGRRTPSSVEVVSGLAEGDRVILHPPNELRDGAKVKVR